jgi:methylmalonyl-CoA/ethylmalonyl-CoA epimerase
LQSDRRKTFWEEAVIRRIDHIAIAVRDLKKAKAFFIDMLGGRELFSAPVEKQKFRWTTIELGTSCFIELIDPLEEEGFLHRFLQQRGEGPHHITIQVRDIQETQRVLENRGVPTFGLAETFPNWKELYIHPKHAFGTLIQFAEFNPLEWVNPGYVPAAYREFVGGQEGDGEEKSLEVRSVETGTGSELEIRSGKHTIRLPESRLNDLMDRLKKFQKPARAHDRGGIPEQ